MAAAASPLLLDEYFSSGDDRFLDEVLASTSAKRLKGLAERWYKDARPFARQALFRYVDDGCDRPHHRPLVKALFKLAEKSADDEAMGHFLVAFDRLTHRAMRTRDRWNSRARSSVKVLEIRQDKSAPERSRGQSDPHFSRSTRRYLARRALRYFRVIGRSDPARYGRAIRAALAIYREEHLDQPQKVLDAWGLVHLLYWSSPALVRKPRGILVAEGYSLSDLAPAPLWPAAWEGVLGDVVTLLKKAESRTVRTFALRLLRSAYASELHKIPILRLRALLLSPNEEVQTFGAELLRGARDIHQLPVADWLELLSVESAAALTIVCELVEKHVSPQRLSLADCVDLGRQKPASVARLGLAWAKKKAISSEKDLAIAMRFAGAACDEVRAEAAVWLADLVGASSFSTPEHARELMDARFADVRAAGLGLLEKNARFQDVPLLWAALAESPYDDARAFLIKHLDARAGAWGGGPRSGSGARSITDAIGDRNIRRVWATVLLGIARGSRTKRKALDQLATRIATTPGDAEGLVPLLGVALRSVRPPERLAALAAVTRAAVRTPALQSALSKHLPELRVERNEVAT